MRSIPIKLYVRIIMKKQLLPCVFSLLATSLVGLDMDLSMFETIRKEQKGDYYIDGQTRDQTLAEIERVLRAENQRAYDILRRAYNISDEKWIAAQPKIKYAQMHHLERLYKPKPNRYVDPKVPKQIVAYLEVAAQSRGIHPHSFDILVDTKTMGLSSTSTISKEAIDSFEAAAKLRINNSHPFDILTDPFFGMLTATDSKIALSPSLIADAQSKTNQFLDHVSRLISYKKVSSNLRHFHFAYHVLDYELTNLIQGDLLKKYILLGLAVEEGTIKPLRYYNSVERTETEIAYEYVTKLTKLNADLFGDLKDKEKAYCTKISLAEKFPSLIDGIEFPVEDKERFHVGIVSQWNDIICRAHEGETFEQLYPKIQVVLKEQESRLYGFDWQAYSDDQRHKALCFHNLCKSSMYGVLYSSCIAGFLFRKGRMKRSLNSLR